MDFRSQRVAYMKIDNWRNFVKDNLKGNILEIGALHNPLAVDNHCTSVTYVDIYPTSRLKEIHKDNKNFSIDDIVEVDVIARGDKLEFPEDTFDAVVSCHAFEHLCNPLRALFQWIKITKNGGHIYMIVPDMRFTFDKNRELTSVAHLVNDYIHDIDEVELSHYQSVCNHIESHKPEQAEGMFKAQSNTHVHTFTEDSLKELLANFKVLDFKRDGMHLCVLIEVEK